MTRERDRKARADARRRASRKRLARSLYPKAIERDFERHLIALVRRIRSETLRRLRPVFESYREAHARATARAKEARGDAAPWGAPGPETDREVAAAWNRILSTIASVRTLAKLVDPEAEKVVVERIGRGVISFNRAKVRDFIAADPREAWKKRVMMIDVADVVPEELLQGFIAENVDLITSIPETTFDRMERVIRKSLSAGADPKTLAKIIEESFDVSKSRARLIARDQVAKANGQITRKTHEDAGVTRYRWVTARDERVRGNPAGLWPEGRHFDLDGKVFSWREPPIVDPKRGRREHPGGDYQCRCVAIPVLDDDET